LRRYLITRGVVLVALELTVLRLCWTFNVDIAHYNLAGVIWMLGWSMIALAGLTKFSTKTVGIVGLAIIFAQQLVALPFQVAPESVKSMIGWLWNILYMGDQVHLGPGGPPLDSLHVLILRVVVIAAGTV